jgi:hypothetical protein
MPPQRCSYPGRGKGLQVERFIGGLFGLFGGLDTRELTFLVFWMRALLSARRVWIVERAERAAVIVGQPATVQ